MNSTWNSSPVRWGNLRWVLAGLALAVLPTITDAAISSQISTTMAWKPNPASRASGYNIYYGTESGNYTNMISVGNVTNATIDGLDAGKDYYFAATSKDANGNESGFSNEAVFRGYNVASGSGGWSLNLFPPALTNDQVTFSLASGAPSGVSINPTNGILEYSNTGLDNANSTNVCTVIITDLTNPNASTETTILLAVSDYLGLRSESVPLQTGQSNSLPLTAVASDAITNLIFNLDWPGTRLIHPSLTFYPPVTGGVLYDQGTNLLVQLWCDTGVIPPGTNQIGCINFEAAPGQLSAFLNLPVSVVYANKSGGAVVDNTVQGSGEVVVVGTNPLLRPHVDLNQARTLTLYANPGTPYELQYTTNFLSDNWQSLGAYQPSSVAQTINLDASTPVIYYRLMQN